MALKNTKFGPQKIGEMLKDRKNLFFAGIGGISMNSLAHLSMLRGFDVAGYDRSESDITRKLEKNGAKVYYEANESHMKDREALIYTVAMPESNPEYRYAEENSIPVISRSDYLGYLMSDYRTRIGVSGTHGKSTTTAMIGKIFKDAGDRPTVLNGAVMKETGTVDIIGDRDYFVFEACEYMDSFLEFFPTIAVVLNIEVDHVDYFNSLNQIVDSFTNFINIAGSDGYAVINLNDKDCIAAAEKSVCKVVSFAHENSNADYYSDNEVSVGGFPEFDVMHEGKKLARIKLKIPGEHNVSDALAAFAAASLCGVDPETIAASLSSFEGIKRRMEKICETDRGSHLYTDYAHHPTEITASIRGIRKICTGKLKIVFQPHTFSRTASLFDDFVRAFAGSEADEIILCDIYPARETNVYGVSSEMLSEAINAQSKPCSIVGDFDKTAEYVYSSSGEDDIIVVMGAGDVVKVSDIITDRHKA